MLSKREKRSNRLRRKRRVRKKVSGRPEKPRLSVFKSNKHTYAQLIDDFAGHTIVAASTVESDFQDDYGDLERTEQAAKVGERLAERAEEEGIDRVVFDRNGFRYHGRLEALAEGAREAGLDF